MFTKVLLLSQFLALSYAQLGIPNSNLAGTPWPLMGGKEIDASVFSEEHALDYEWTEHRTSFHEPETTTMPSLEVEQEAAAKIPDDGLAAAADGIALDTGANAIPETTTPEPEIYTVPETTQPTTTTTTTTTITQKSHEHKPHPEIQPHAHPLPYPESAQKPILTEPVPAYKPAPDSQHGFPSLDVEQEATAKIPDDGLAAAADGFALDTGAKSIPETTTAVPETSTVPETTQPTTTTTTTTTAKPHELESHPEIRPHAYPMPYPQPAQKPIPTEPVPAYKPATDSQHGFAPYPAFGHSGFFPHHPHHFPHFGHGPHFGPHFHHSHHHHQHPHMDFDNSNSDEQSGEDIMFHHPKKSQEDYPRAYVHPPFIHSFPSPARGYNAPSSYGYGR